MIASIYLLVAVPTVFVVSILIFVLTQFRSKGVFVIPAFSLSILPFAIMNLGLVLYIYLILDQTDRKTTSVDWIWFSTIIGSIILLIISSRQSRSIKRSTEQGAAANP